MIDRNIKIAIIGGGIGGLVAGIALQKAGFAPIIFERAPVLGEVGAGISMTPNATKGLVSLGFGAFLEKAGNKPLSQIQRHGETGEHLISFDRRDCRETYGAAYYQLHRADLLNVLMASFGLENCFFDRELMALDQSGGKVAMHFTGSDKAEADIVIGADGLRSVVRDILFDTPQPEFSGHVAWRGLVPASSLPAEYSKANNVNHVAPGRACVTYPVRGTDLVNIVALTKSDSEWVEESWGARAKKTDLLAQFDGWTDYVITALKAIPNDEIYRWGLFVREPLQNWVKGRVGLLGDAAHPMLPYMGQGASSAVEDGTVLGRCFAECSNAQKALAVYQATRMDRAALLQSESNAGGDRLMAIDPYILRDIPVKGEDALGIFAYDPATVTLVK